MKKTIVIVAISPNCWGRGFTLSEAQKNLKGSGGKLKGAIYRAAVIPEGTDKEVYVNGMGDMMLPQGAEYFKI